MSAFGPGMNERLKEAVRHFWIVRQGQSENQGGRGKKGRDRGERGAVTGGKHMDGFIRLIRQQLAEAGVTAAHIYCKPRQERIQDAPQQRRKKQEVPAEIESTRTVLPGWFRAEKDWDFVVVMNGCLVASIEFKSHVGSFGNNFNNRAEEALGNATDLLAAYREGAFRPSIRPWLGYLMLLEEAPKSTRPVRVIESHFRVFDEFRGASYGDRYNLLLTKLVRERLYDSACFLMSKREEGLAFGAYSEPNPELGFQNFLASLLGHTLAVAKINPPPAVSAQRQALPQPEPPDL